MPAISRTEAGRSFTAAVAYAAAFADANAADEVALDSVAADLGHYDGLPARIVLLGDGRNATLIDPIAYHRPDGSDWPVPAGANLDGASIPRAFWTMIGGPFEGKYRDASIVHDHYCSVRTRRWEDTHRMFHDAMRCSGVAAAKAGIMFYAVYRFGRRWPAPGLETVASAASLPTDRDAASFVADAEAIARHDLNPDEIAALAEARRTAADAALEGVGAAGDDPRLLVVAGGTGTPEDIAAVAAHAAALPRPVIDHFFDKGVRIVACRNAITDFEQKYRGKIPRGWEKTGRTWDSVPGTYLDKKKRVVIATVTGGGGARVVPDKTSGLHGSDSLVVHESLHGYDYSLGHAPLGDPHYVTARAADLAGLSDYERQDGRAGLEETFAETGAQFCVTRPTLAARCPRLDGYWASAVGGAVPAPGAPNEGVEAAEPIGTATRAADGRITLDLRATGPDGEIGHAALVIEPGDPAHAELESTLFPAASDALESTAPQTVLFHG